MNEAFAAFVKRRGGRLDDGSPVALGRYERGHLRISVRAAGTGGLSQSRVLMQASFVNPGERRLELRGQAPPHPNAYLMAGGHEVELVDGVRARSGHVEVLQAAQQHGELNASLRRLRRGISAVVLDDEGVGGPLYGEDVDVAVVMADRIYSDAAEYDDLERVLVAVLDCVLGQPVLHDERPLLTRMIGALNDRTAFFATDFGPTHAGVLSTAGVPEQIGPPAKIWIAGPDMPANFCRLQLDAPLAPLHEPVRSRLSRLLRFLFVPALPFEHPLLDRLREATEGEVVFDEEGGMMKLRISGLGLAEVVDAADLSLRFWHQLVKERMGAMGL